MRQTRVKIRRKSMGKKITFTIIIIFLFSLSILIGYLGTKYVILPMISSNEIGIEKNNKNKGIKKVVKMQEEISEASKEESEKNNKTKKIDKATNEGYTNTFEIEGIDIYSVQVGSFKTKQNALSLVKELNSKDIGAYIWDNDGYKVITMSMLDRKSIDNILPNIKKQYTEAFVVTRRVSSKSISYKKEDSAYIDTLEGQIKKLMEVFKALAENIKQSQNSQIDMELAKKHIDDLKEIQGRLRGENPPVQMKAMHNGLIKLVADLIQELETAEKNDKKLFLGIQNAFIKGVYQYSYFLDNNEY
ncbi:SPOR domain-containing protein [Crassaminicella indica]|uniref:SPOR domain-containing protein n=1 Tax=Crassaminicella indica TaxID=2855394 RepID=A0ABX8RDE0_9CLOT|nr:SPOR domain-containing protein [Crassaminicella indica]QXM05740.1 SPOR domain-containing protein [Crassaminicella indica]